MNKGTVVIAGASGFVGRYLIEALSKEGYSIVALSRRNRS
ncbi:MAG: NAD-dependent epimerase/dehydratase family protein, partial [bacterium]|nr:NAD-dependent epimerase/dehydratase family protein [bacterium]